MNKKWALVLIGVGFMVIIGSVIFMNHLLRTQGVACMADPFGYGIAVLDASHNKPDVCSCRVSTEQGLRDIVVSGNADLVTPLQEQKEFDTFGGWNTNGTWVNP